MRVKLNLVFSGTATVEMDADTPEAARGLAADLTLADLARSGHTDILSFKVAAREATPTSALGGEGDDTQAPDAPRTVRPSGWYRPK